MANTDMLSKSAAYNSMAPYWEKVDAIYSGADAVKAKREVFLPKFPNESAENYNYRVTNAQFTNIYSDIVENLAAKPFTKEVSLSNSGSHKIFDQIIEDVDGSGSHLNVFASNVFFEGIHRGITWILVDYPQVPAGATLADERASGARPYWVHVEATDLLWVESAVIAGKEQIVYAKINEPRIERDSDGSEKIIQRVRVLTRDKIDGGYAPARFEVWEQSSEAWSIVDEGPISLGVIPLVPFYTGRRKGGTWQITPPMRDVADLQIEHYQAETNLKNAKELTAFPMLAGNGIDAPRDDNGNVMQIPVGPSAILYAPPYESGASHGNWQIIEPSAASLNFLSGEVDKIEKRAREIGRQPLTTASTGITQVAAAFASQKAASAVQSWAFFLKDALENVFVYTAMWLGIEFEPTVFVNSDFAIELGEDKAPDVLLAMWKDGAISMQTLWLEMKRRNILSPEFDAGHEEALLLDMLPDETTEDMQVAMTPESGGITNEGLVRPI